MQLKAYNETWLRNQVIQEQAQYWHRKQLLTPEQLAQVASVFPNGHYRPNIWIRVGLFFFTSIAASFALGLTSVFTFAIFSDSFGGGFISLAYGAMFYAAALFLIREKKLYHSGVDNALVYGALGWTFGGFGLMLTNADTFNILLFSYIVLVLLVVVATRHADWLLTLGATLCVFWILNYQLAQFSVGKLLLPFANMLLAAGLYALKKRYFEQDRYFYWAGCLTIVEVVALVLFYVGGNYGVVREGNALLNGNPSGQIAFAWLFYAFTALIPLLYLGMGLRYKDRKLIVLGILGIAISVGTYKYYFGFLPPEVSITLAGALLIVVAWACIRYLSPTRHGYTHEQDRADEGFDAEAMIIAQTLGKTLPTDQGLKFGGGDFGGGGAGDKY